MMPPVEFWLGVLVGAILGLGGFGGYIVTGIYFASQQENDRRFVDSFIVDLDRYEADCLLAKRRGKRPIPIRPIPGQVAPRLSRYDWGIIHANHRRANAIREHIFGGGDRSDILDDPPDPDYTRG